MLPYNHPRTTLEPPYSHKGASRQQNVSERRLGRSHHKSRWLVAIGILATAFIGCHRQGDSQQVLAEVYGHKLLRSDVQGLVSEGIPSADSLLIVDNYIEQWIRQMVVLSKAEKNVKENFDRQLDDYRNSLLTYAYEQQIVQQLIDTVVTDEQVAEYYAQHQSDFHLRNSIVKAVYVVAPRQSTAVARLRTMVTKGNFGESDIVALEEYASSLGLTGYYDATVWIPFYTLQSAVPIQTHNEDLYLKQNRSVAISDDSLAYFVRILDYKVSDDISPLETPWRCSP